MNIYAFKIQENKTRAAANSASQSKNRSEPTFQFADNRPEAIVQRKLQELANSHAAQQQLPQKKASSESGRRENNTGLPDNLKTGVENLSGYSMDDVKVHRNSGKPAQLQAHAYAQGSEIHLGPGQEKHLPHEVWHVVQQKQGRVKPTMQILEQSGNSTTTEKSKIEINDDSGLEREADVMGAKALQNKSTLQEKSKIASDSFPIKTALQAKAPVQCFLLNDNGLRYRGYYSEKIHAKKNRTKGKYLFKEIKAMIDDDIDYQLTVKQAFLKLKKEKMGSKPQSASSKIKGRATKRDISDEESIKYLYGYTTQGGSVYKEEEEIYDDSRKRARTPLSDAISEDDDLNTFIKRRRVTETNKVNRQTEYRNDAPPEESRMLIKNHYVKPANFYKKAHKLKRPYASAHRTPSFFDARGGKNEGDDYRNADMTSDAHNKRHSKFEGGIRTKLNQDSSLADLTYKVDTKHSIVKDSKNFAKKVKKELKLVVSKERLEKFYNKRQEIEPELEYISSDQRSVYDSNSTKIDEMSIGPDYEMDLPRKFFSQKERDMEGFRRAQYHGKGSIYETLDSNSEDSELDDEPPGKGSRTDYRSMTKSELKNVIEELEYHSEKRLSNDGLESLKKMRKHYNSL
ncbi:DUF4157 domain-containing protein [Marivirga sp. S37H4]|uniref:DUF4157 domain-containing protein n=1 Tax=Marivirga aurantiaca TaxID=2802615 RepID=A0A935C802_9BACT|nr:DUF4157 domain-containing protein [Marivirga aurantiaca]MBK6263413.1 DUF4157 domain-containing protein [Marivirga aurantiaca]